MVAQNIAETDVSSRQVEITRIFDAPRELVFNAWTSAESLGHWFAPHGCQTRFSRLEFRVGGSFLSCVSNPEFGDCWCAGVYRDIVTPERIVFTMAVADEHGNLIEPTVAGHNPEWPRETTVTVTFEDLGGQTKLTLQQTVLESLAKRTGAYPSWLQMLDRLAAELRPVS